jgi:hypothetical protein
VNSGRWLWRWPNLALNLYPDAMNVERYEPVTLGRTRLSYSYFFRRRQTSCRPRSGQPEIGATDRGQDLLLVEHRPAIIADDGAGVMRRHEQGVDVLL